MKAELQWIWAYHIKHKARRVRERLFVWIAWHLPRDLVSWCYTRVGAEATTGKYSDVHPGDVKMMDALNQWIYQGEVTQ